MWSGGAAVASVQYTYAHNGTGQLMHRTANGSTTRFHWSGFSPYLEEDGSGDAEYAYFGSGMRFDLGASHTVDSSDAAHFYLHDEAGNIIAVADKTGALESHFEFDAWGNDLGGNFTTNAQDIRRFRTGKFFDDVTGLYYNQARWYDPTLGRFISESPIAPFAEEDYAYCGNDPVNFVDVNGLERTLREKTVDTLSELANYIFDHTLTPILNNLIPQNRANTPPGLFPGGKECTSVSNDIEDLSHIVADEVLNQIENKLPFLSIFFCISDFSHKIHQHHIFPREFTQFFNKQGITTVPTFKTKSVVSISNI